MSDTNESVEVEFDQGDGFEVPVPLDAIASKRAAERLKRREKMQERADYELYGIRVIRLKLKTYQLLKKQIDDLGIKTVGHCGLMLAREKIESYVMELDGIDKEMKDGGATAEARLAAYELRLAFIKEMINSSAEHLRSERQPQDGQSSKVLQLPFEAGTPIAVAIGNKPVTIEDGKAGV